MIDAIGDTLAVWFIQWFNFCTTTLGLDLGGAIAAVGPLGLFLGLTSVWRLGRRWKLGGDT